MKKQVSIMLSLILLFTMIFGSSVSAESIYTVKAGDVLWKISKQYGLTYQEVADYNKLANPNLIYVNQKLKIPTKAELAAQENGEVSLTLLATSDLHGRIYPYEYAVDSADQDAGLAKVQTLVKAERAANENVILMDLGDTTQDNSAELFMDEKVHPMVDALNYMGYDTWTLGNHEFNFEKSFLDNNIATFEGDVLAANIYKADGTRFVKPYTIIEKDGVRVAIVGIVPPHIPLWEASAPEHFEGLTFTETLAETKKVIEELKGKYDVLVGAYHIGKEGEHGYEGAAEIAEACPEFDVMFLGHAHSKINGEVINGVTLIEPGAYGWAVSKAQLTIEKKDGIITVKSVVPSNLETLNVEADADMLARYQYVHDQSMADANTVVGKVSERFIDEVDFITGADKVTTMATAQVKDTALMDLINEVQQFYTGADVSSAAAFKSDMNLLAGDFKKKDVANIYLYPNTLMGVNITGANLKKYMEWSANYYNTYELGDITVSFNPNIRGYNYDMFSGVTYDIDISQAEGKRIKNLKLDGKAIDDTATYKLAVNNYRFGTLLGLELVTNDDVYYDSYALMQDAGRIRDLIIKYITEEKDGVAAPVTDNNWKIIGNDFDHELVDEAMELIKDGTVKIPTSEDGRTLNVEAVNVYDLIEDGYFPEYSTLTILHTNDVHGFYVEGAYDGMGAAKMMTYFDQMKERFSNVLVLDAGDATQGANLVTLSEGKTAIEIMNALGYDAMTAGNHEFDYGSEVLLENAALADFPILAANIKTATGENFLPAYTIEEIDGLKVAIFGIATPETIYKSHPDNTVGLTFEDPNTVAAEMVEELTPLADVIVALVHLGDEGDLTSHKLAEEVEGIDVIIDGHSHSKYENGVLVNGTLIASAETKSINVGLIQMTLKADEVVDVQADLFTKAQSLTLSDDEEVAALVNEIKEKNAEIENEVVASAPFALEGTRDLVRTGETNLGNLITAALLDISGADVALTNGGGIRASIDAGDVTKGEVLTVLPYGNTVKVIEVTGAELIAAIENGIGSYPEASGGFPHIAGMTVEFDSTLEKGERVTKLMVGDSLVDETKIYKLATNDFTAAGGDGYTMFVGKPAVAEFGSMDQVLIDYLNNVGFDAADITDRIKDIADVDDTAAMEWLLKIVA